MAEETSADIISRTLAGAGSTMPPVTGTLDNVSSMAAQMLRMGASQVEGPKAFQAGEAPSFFGGFIKTMVHGGTSGLIGRDPHEAFWDPEAVSRFAVDSPWASLAAEILGSGPAFAVPYIGQAKGLGLGLRVAKALPGLSRAATFATSPTAARARPLVTAAVKEMVRFAPLELARVGGAVLDFQQEGSVPKVLGQIAFEMPVFAAFGGAAKALRGSSTFRGRNVGKEVEIQNAFDFYNLNGSPQERLRQTARAREILRESAGLHPKANLLELPEGQVPAAVSEFDELINGVQADLRATIVNDIPPAPNAYVRLLVGEGGKTTAAALNTVLRLGEEEKAGNILVRKFKIGKGGYQQDAAMQMQRDLSAAGISADSMAYVQYPRVIETLNEAGTEKMRKLMGKGGFQRLSHNINETAYIAREADGGYWYARRIQNAKAARRTIDPKNYKTKKAYEKALAEAIEKGKSGAKYVLFRTDKPLAFEPRAEGFAEAMLRIYKPLRPPRRSPLEAEAPVFDMLKKLDLAHPRPEETLGVPKRTVTKFIEGRMGAEAKATMEVVGRRIDHLAGVVKSKVAPGIFALAKSKRAQRIWSIARAAHNRTNMLIELEFFGSKLASKARTLVGSLFEVPEFRNSPYMMLQGLDDTAMKQLSNVWLNRLSIADAKRLNYSNDLIKFLRVIERNDAKRTAEAVATQARARELGFDVGEQEFIPLSSHYGLVRSWTGNFRHAILNEDGKAVGYGSGHTAQDATADARRVVERAEQQGATRTLFLDRAANTSTREEDLLLAKHLDKQMRGQDAYTRARASLAITPPASQTHPERGFLGAIGSSGSLTKKEVQEVLLSNIAATRRNNLNIAMRIHHLDEFARLREEHPDLYLDLIKRMNLRAGIAPQSGISAMVNKGLDAILAPYLGKNSGTKIVNTVNQGLYTLTLGAFDLGFAAVNMVTPLITSAPEIAFLDRAAPELIERYYSTLASSTLTGIRPFKALNPLRILSASVRDLYKVTPGTEKWEFFQRAVSERIVDPKFIEEFTGQSSAKIWGKAVKDEGWAEWLFRLSNFPAAKSEELSRGTSFMMGLNYGKDFRGLEGERLFQFAREFTERTQFLYSAADRPQILTGPLGQAFGLFKNWGMHHMGLLAGYHGEAFLSGNFAPLLWTGVGAGAVGGMGAMPWLEVADRFSLVASDKSLQENLYDAIGYNDGAPSQYFADTLWYGLPGSFGLSLQSRATPVSNNPVHDVSMLFSIVAWDRMKWMGDFLGSAIDHSTVTRTPLVSSRELMDKFVRATSPRSIYRFASINAEGKLRSLRTQGQLVKDISLMDHLAYAAGINPLEIEKFFTVDEQVWRRQDVRRTRIDALGSQMAEAMELEDVGAQNQIMGSAAVNGLVDSVLRSAMQRRMDHMLPRDEREWKDHVDRTTARALGVGK